jgi:hypothetical protein
MWSLKRKADPQTSDELRAEIDRLAGSRRERGAEQRLLRLRHQLGLRLLEEAGADPRHPDPSGVVLPPAEELPEVSPDDLTPELLRAGILRDGCVLVRGLVPRGTAVHLAEEIDRTFAERKRTFEGGRPEAGYYDEFRLDPRRGVIDPALREWVWVGGGVLAADAPNVAAQMFDAFRAAGLPQLVEAYLGEPPLLTFEKTTLRKADPAVPGAWHQDGHFMGPVRALNLWLSLSRCGDESPGLDVVPRRLPELVTAGVDGAILSYQVTDERAAEVASPKRVIRPIFEPGDALLFDELFLHQTGSDPAMPKPRYAIESWFFGGSAFPDYAPIAV